MNQAAGSRKWLDAGELKGFEDQKPPTSFGLGTSRTAVMSEEKMYLQFPCIRDASGGLDQLEPKFPLYVFLPNTCCPALPCRLQGGRRLGGAGESTPPSAREAGSAGRSPFAPNTGIDNKPIGSPSLLLKPPFHLTAPSPHRPLSPSPPVARRESDPHGAQGNPPTTTTSLPCPESNECFFGRIVLRLRRKYQVNKVHGQARQSSCRAPHVALPTSPSHFPGCEFYA